MPVLPDTPRRRIRTGFTLVELLVVVVLIGILATLAIPKFGFVRERSVRGTLIADLRNLASAQESHYVDQSRYNGTLDSLGFDGSWGVRVMIVEASTEGWSARATRTGFRGVCAIHHGNAAPLLPGAVADQVRCGD